MALTLALFTLFLCKLSALCWLDLGGTRESNEMSERLDSSTWVQKSTFFWVLTRSVQVLCCHHDGTRLQMQGH